MSEQKYKMPEKELVEFKKDWREVLTQGEKFADVSEAMRKKFNHIPPNGLSYLEDTDEDFKTLLKRTNELDERIT